jgi:MFS transporter, YNFM family, putative membrane transport protein
MKARLTPGLPVAGWLLLFAGSTQALAFAPLFPALRAEMELAPGALSVLAGSYTVVFAGATLLSAPLLRRLGARRLLTLATFLLGAGLALLPWAPSLAMLVGLRLVSALGHGLLTPTIVLSLAAEGSAASYRTTGWVLSGHGTSHLVGVPLLVWLVGDGMLPTKALGTLGVGLLGVVALVWACHPRAAPTTSGPAADLAEARVSWRDLWTRQPSRFVLLGAFLATAATSSFVLYFPLLLTAREGTGGLAGWMFLGGLAQVLAVVGGGRWAARHGLRAVLLSSTLGSVVLALLWSLDPTRTWLLGAAFIVLSGLSGLRATPLQVGIGQLCHAANRPAATALLNALHQLGRATGSSGGLLLLPPGGALPWTVFAALTWLSASVLFASGTATAASHERKKGEEPALAR